jgi:hypothetical protein
MNQDQCGYCHEPFPMKGEQMVALEMKNEHDRSHYGFKWLMFHPKCHSDLIFDLDESVKDEIGNMTMALNDRKNEVILEKLRERRKLLEQ